MSKPDHVVWVDVLSYLRAQRPLMCRQWFDEIEPVGVVDAVYIARITHSIRQKYLQKECAEAFNEALQVATGNLLTIRFLGPDDAPAPTPRATSFDHHASTSGSLPNGSINGHAQAPTPRRAIQHTTPTRHDGLIISPDNTFENFIVGPENRMAHAAAISVSTKPGASYNPLFIHGGVGLGKTHLLQAMCLQIMSAAPSAAICYVSCEEFMSQFMDAVQAGQMAEFRHRFRDVDALVIDDIHFLAKRDRTQEEFFHTFNSLHQAGKQIILSSDAPPTEIPDLEARLVSRFQSGLVVDITPPCFETRVQIVKQKARIRGIEMDESVAFFIAQRGVNNIRELEGAIAKVRMISAADNRPIDLSLAQTALGQSDTSARPQITINTIIDAVVSYYNVKLTDLQSKRRQKSITRPRQVCMYLARRFTRFSLEEIGGHFGGRDHTTVMHAQRVIAKFREENPDFAVVLDRLEERIHAANGAAPTSAPQSTSTPAAQAPSVTVRPSAPPARAHA